MHVVFRFARTAATGTAAMACACSAFAADLAFDGNGAAPPEAVGTGAWDVTRANWFDGTGYRTWDNGASDRAVFAKPGTISLGAPVTAGGLAFASSGTWTLSGPHRLTLDSGSEITVASGTTATIASQLAGGFRVAGPAIGQGTLRIASNNAGVFDGRATVGRGATLSLGHVNALGTSHAAENLVLEDGGRLEFGVAGTFRNHYTLTGGTVRIDTLNAGGTFSGSPTLAASTELIFGTRNNAAQQWTGVLADTGPHVLSFGVDAREGFGPTLSGANTYSGDTTLHSGVLTIANAGALSRNSALAFANTTGVPALLSFAFGGTYHASLGNGAGQVRWDGSGGFRSPLGTTTVTLDGNAPLAWGVGHFVPDGAALQIGTGVVLTNAIDLGDQQRDLFGGGTISGALDGTAGLRLRSGVLTLSAANTWTGDTRVEARSGGPFGAQLHLGHAGALPGGIGTTGGTSRLVLDDGMVVLGEHSGDFLRGVGDEAHQVTFAGSGGFASASGVRTVDLGGAGETLAWNAPGFVPHGSALAFGAHAPGASVLFRNGLDLADGERTVQLAATSRGNNVPHRAVTLAGVVSNGSLVFSGFGEAALTGANTYTGRTVIGNGDVSTRVVVDRLADGGVASGIGASTGDAANLVFGATGSNQATLAYLGGATSTNRNFTMLGNAEILSDGTGPLAWHGAPLLVGGNRTLRLGGVNADTNLFAGTLADGGGTLSLAKHGTGTWRLAGRNTFTGGVRIGSNVAGFTDGGTLEVETLGNAADAGGLGINAGNNAARLSMFDGAVLRYVGEGEETDRNLSRGVQAATADRANGIAIESSGTGALAWHGAITMHATANPWLRLGGTHAGDNRLTSVLRDATQAISLAKEGSGTWGLSAANTYTGATEIVDGVLRLEHADAIAGGLGAVDAAGSGIRLSGGILGLTEASGDLTRRLDAESGRNDLAWREDASGGFAAYGATRTVDLGGAGATLAWGAPGFIGDAGALLLGHRTADATLEFRNGLDFANGERNVHVADGAHAIDAVLGGTLVGGGSSGLAKTGDGTLRITGDNTYAGRTRVHGGVLEVAGAGTLGRGDVVVDGNAIVVLARDAIGTFANRIDGDGTLVQRGPGDSVLTGLGSRIGRVQIEQGALAVDGSLEVAQLDIGEGALRVSGLVQGQAGATANIDAADGTRSAIVVDAGGALRAQGGLGNADDLLAVAGTFDAGADVFALGDGDDTLVLRDGASIGGRIDGGTGDDQLMFERFRTSASRLAAFANIERMHLRDSSEVVLDTVLDVRSGNIDVDASSALIAHGDARVRADVHNAGTLRANAGTIAIAGNYTAAHGARLHVTVSPSSKTAGNLVVEGDVRGTTGVVFASDGTPGLSPASIRIVSAPNDVAGEGAFVAQQARNDVVRLGGSPYAWTFSPDAAKTGWFLRTDEDEQAPVLLPELPAYSVLPSVAAIATQDTHRIVFDRLAAVRGDADVCRTDKATTRGRDRMHGACRGAWMATFGGELDVAANPGAAFRGDTHGMLAGTDRVVPSDAGTTLRAGAYAGVVRGDHSSSGAHMAERVDVAPARMRSTSPVLGMYAGRTSAGGGFVDAHVTATRVSAKVHVADGFADTQAGSVLAMRLQAGRRFDADGWSLEPQVELGVAARQWRDKVDAGGRHVDYVDDAVGTARVGLRVERTAHGGVRPWATVAVGDTLGEATDALRLHAPDGAMFALPGHDLGLAATVDLGVEARLGAGLDLYGTMSAAERLRGSHVSQRQATLGVRWHW